LFTQVVKSCGHLMLTPSWGACQCCNIWNLKKQISLTQECTHCSSELKEQLSHFIVHLTTFWPTFS
jgi:hypothetical protein